MPLAESRRCYFRCRDLVPALIIVIKPKVVFERVSPHDVIQSVREAKHDTARGIFPARDRLEANGDIEASIWTSRCYDDVKGAPFRSKHQHSFCAWRAGH